MSSSVGQTSGSPQGQQMSSTPNHIYDLCSVLYHAMKSDTSTQGFIRDAQQAGNNDLVQFFQQIQQEDRRRIQQAQQLLGQQWMSAQPTH